MGWDWSHPGITRLFTDIASNNYQVVRVRVRVRGFAACVAVSFPGGVGRGACSALPRATCVGTRAPLPHTLSGDCECSLGVLAHLPPTPSTHLPCHHLLRCPRPQITYLSSRSVGQASTMRNHSEGGRPPQPHPHQTPSLCPRPQMMYLSSRSVGQASVTRDYVNTLVQGGHHMPIGPVIISPQGLLPSLYRCVCGLTILRGGPALGWKGASAPQMGQSASPASAQSP